MDMAVINLGPEMIDLNLSFFQGGFLKTRFELGTIQTFIHLSLLISGAGSCITSCNLTKPLSQLTAGCNYQPTKKKDWTNSKGGRWKSKQKLQRAAGAGQQK